jgi:Zn-dependent peptidase ImmA (M78 family)
MKKIVFTFGRYNPPTTGHAELIHYAVNLAHRTGAEHRIYTSQSHDSSKNPLSPKQKMAFLRQIFPGVNFVDDPSMKTAFAICKKLADDGYEDVTFVVGDDRVNEFKTQLGKYVKPKTAKDFDPKRHYPFEKFQVVSSGARKQGISGTDLRAAVRKGDFTTFAKASAAKDKTLARKIFTATRTQLKEWYLREERGLSRQDFHDKLMSFVDFTCAHLGIDEKPTIKYKEDRKEGQPSFAAYSPHSKEVYISTKNRHPMDVFRSVAHELVHHKQNLDGRLGKNIAKEGATGSKIENEANSEAGKIMRYFGNLNPFYFDMDYLKEQDLSEINKGVLRRYIGYANTDRKKLAVDRRNRNWDPTGFDSKKTDDDYKRKIGNRVTGIERAQDRYDGTKPYTYKEDKAIILSGTPGSGKDKILKEAILPFGFTEISADNFHNQKLQGAIVVNGASDYLTVKTIKEALELKGYETIMVFVNTSNEVSKQRNESRATKGGRVITEAVRFAKWKGAQESLDRFDQLFEKVIEVKNDLDLNLNENVIKETYDKLIHSVSKEIAEFALNEADKRFEKMLNEVGGAGNWGTQQLTDKYKLDTPGQEPGKFAKMKVLKLKNENNVKSSLDPRNQNPGPIGGDRIGDEAGMPKGPGFGDNQSLDFTGVNGNRQIDRWMVKEETRKRFMAKYGALADKKIKETAERLKRESLDDPFSGTMASASATLGNDDVRTNTVGAEDEKTSLFKKNKYKKKKYTK